MDYQTSVTLVGKVLDGLSLRSVVTAQNIANANSIDYTAQKVSFEESLARAFLQSPSALRAHQAEIVNSDRDGVSTEMRIDLEIATATQTALRYSALTELLNSRMQIARLAIRGPQ